MLDAHAPDEEPDGKVHNEDTPVRELHLAGVGLHLFLGMPRSLILIEHHDPLPHLNNYSLQMECVRSEGL